MRAVLVAPKAIGRPVARGDDLLDPDAVAGLNRGHRFGPLDRNAGKFQKRCRFLIRGAIAVSLPLLRKSGLLVRVVRSVAGQDLEVKSFRESRSTLKVSVDGPFTISDCVDE